MRQRNDPIKIQSDGWDPDEAAWIKPRVSFSASQRVAYHASQFKAMDAIGTEGEARAQVDHMTAVLVDLLDHWTFRDQTAAYEPGVERLILELTEAALADCDTADVTYLFTEAMRLFAGQTAPPADIITPAAAQEGLQPS